MLRCLLCTIKRASINLKQDAANKLGKMADKIETMNDTMNKTSPKIFSIFMIVSTLPSFYFGYKMITADYHTQDFTDAAHAGLISPTAMHTMPSLGMVGRTIPPLLSLIALALPSSDNKYITLPTFMADFSMLIVQSQAANFGTLPFWLYSYRHYCRFFDWAILLCTFFALRNLKDRTTTHSHQFAIRNTKQTSQNQQSVPN